MQHIEQQEQQPIVSQRAKRDRKIHNFKQYLVDSGCVLHFVKFMLGIRNKQKFDQSVPSSDALQMFKDYIGAVQIDATEHNQLKQQIQQMNLQNIHLKQQIVKIQLQLKAKKEQKQRKAEQARLKQEQQASKNAKKGAKK